MREREGRGGRGEGEKRERGGRRKGEEGKERMGWNYILYMFVYIVTLRSMRSFNRTSKSFSSTQKSGPASIYRYNIWNNGYWYNGY